MFVLANFKPNSTGLISMAYNIKMFRKTLCTRFQNKKNNEHWNAFHDFHILIKKTYILRVIKGG